MSEQRLAPSERLHALARLPRAKMSEVSAEAAIVRIARQYSGRWGKDQMHRDDMITLMREVCDANGWKYTGGR